MEYDHVMVTKGNEQSVIPMFSNVFSEFAENLSEWFSFFFEKLLGDVSHVLDEVSDWMMGQNITFERGADLFDRAVFIKSR